MFLPQLKNTNNQAGFIPEMQDLFHIQNLVCPIIVQSMILANERRNTILSYQWILNKLLIKYIY